MRTVVAVIKITDSIADSIAYSIAYSIVDSIVHSIVNCIEAVDVTQIQEILLPLFVLNVVVETIMQDIVCESLRETYRGVIPRASAI